RQAHDQNNAGPEPTPGARGHGERESEREERRDRGAEPRLPEPETQRAAEGEKGDGARMDTALRARRDATGTVAERIHPARGEKREAEVSDQKNAARNTVPVDDGERQVEVEQGRRRARGEEEAQHPDRERPPGECTVAPSEERPREKREPDHA